MNYSKVVSILSNLLTQHDFNLEGVWIAYATPKKYFAFFIFKPKIFCYQKVLDLKFLDPIFLYSDVFYPKFYFVTLIFILTQNFILTYNLFSLNVFDPNFVWSKNFVEQKCCQSKFSQNLVLTQNFLT